MRSLANPKRLENPREIKQFPEILIEYNFALRDEPQL
jgi:hypothetical protein